MLTRLSLVLVVTLAAGCGDEDGPRFNSREIAAVCVKVLDFCPTFGAPFGATDEESCKTAVSCAQDFYSGACLDTLVEGLECMERVSSSDACSECTAFLSTLYNECPPPEPCL